MNIFVGGLARTVTPEDLHMAFSGFGTVINILIMNDPAPEKPRGYAHVYLVPEQAGRRAIAALHGVVLRGKTLVVRECIYRSPGDRRHTAEPWNEVERRRSPERRNNHTEHPLHSTERRVS